MIARRDFIAGLAAAGLASRSFAAGPHSKINVGVELYSLREDMKKDLPGTLARARGMGFDHVEVPNLYGHSAAEFRRALDQAGLKATVMVAPYDDLQNDLAGVQRNLDALHAHWAVLPWIPHGDVFNRSDADRAAKDMNKWGAALSSAGYGFSYHPHGYEFQPAPEGTLFDVLAYATDPNTVKFELDTFWIVWPGQDCVQLMRRYPTRFRLLHLKDLRKGVKTGDLHGQAPDTDSVTVGDGIVPWKDVLSLAKKQRIEDYFIEDESPNAARQMPRSLQYLRGLGVI